VRRKVSGTPERPRLAVFRSNKHIYAQLIDDLTGKTLVAASTISDNVDGAKTDAATAIGKLVAERAKEAGVELAVFDRGGFLYHGRVAAVAEGARSAGLKF
jgi:large subunit ribosomal protein L18